MQQPDRHIAAVAKMTSLLHHKSLQPVRPCWFSTLKRCFNPLIHTKSEWLWINDWICRYKYCGLVHEMHLDLMNTLQGVKYVCMCLCLCTGNIFFLPLVPLKVYCSAFHCSIEFYAAAVDGKVCNITNVYDFIL